VAEPEVVVDLGWPVGMVGPEQVLVLVQGVEQGQAMESPEELPWQV
jgi:hypothetical protein